jgi:pilus assembly protein Flp/PilA
LRRKRMIRKFLKDESGVTLIEYGLIAALVGLACVVALTTLGGDLQTSFGNISSSLNP